MDKDALDPTGGLESDGRLVARARAGDEAAWAVIVGRHWKRVWNLSWRIVRDRYGAEEVAQETFRVIREKLAEYRGQGSLCGWIQAICRRQALDELRRRSRLTREVSIEGSLVLDGRPAASTEEGWVQHIDLERALALLDDEEREALLMTAAGYTSEELAKLSGVAATTIRSRKARARARLARELEVEYGGRGQ
jgi:RNA polymerase sigma-70 factor (ECF subfamily)